MKATILVTGGAGYIGSHAVQTLQKIGYEVIILDNLICGHRDLVKNTLKAKLIVGDIGDRALLEHIFATYSITAVMHFAAYAYVGESVQDPAKYYYNNVTGTLTLLKAMVAASVNKLVFSSTCATYGVPTSVPITEEEPQNPINPYGSSKLMVERIIADFNHAYGLKSVIFRYFNAAGADPQGRLGEDHTPETHLLPLVLQTALGKLESISIYGNDYSTPDGTCIRDYVHVSDLADAHVLGLEHLLKGGNNEIFNLGNGNGFSVRQVIETAREVTGKIIKTVECERRPGDPPILVGSSEKARKILGWQPQYPELKDILTHAWSWHQQRHGQKQQLAHLPLVSVIIPAYNAEALLERTLDSVLSQTYKNLEVLVIDDGSLDQTAELVKSVAQRDQRVRLLQQQNSGVAVARNLGIKNARGEFIAPIDADDIWYPQNIEKQVQCILAAGENVGLVYSWSVDIDDQDLPLGSFRASKIEGEVYTTLVCHNFIGNASASLLRRACLEKVGGYDSNLKAQKAQGCEDWDLYLRIARNYQFAVVPDFLIGYRKLLNSMSCDYSQMAKSHLLVLEAVQQQQPRIPSLIYQLSKSNLYLYFAHQSSRCSNHQTTLFWLHQALKADLITPFLRYGLYRLLITSIFGLVKQHIITLIYQERDSVIPLQSDLVLAKSELTITNIKEQKITIKLMVLVGDIFHEFISILTSNLGRKFIKV